MDFISLVKTLRREVGATGVDTTVANPVADSEWDRLIHWVADSWNEIQLLHANRWKWMRKTMTFASTTAGKGAYTKAELGLTDHAEWLRKTFRAYLTSIGTSNEQYLAYMPYDAFRNAYLYATARDNQGRPAIVSIDPSDGIILWPAPSDAYTIVADYRATPSALVNDTDTPEMPERFHMLIVYEAMKKYAIFKAASEVYQRGEIEARRIMAALKIDQLEPIRRGGSLI